MATPLFPLPPFSPPARIGRLAARKSSGKKCLTMPQSSTSGPFLQPHNHVNRRIAYHIMVSPWPTQTPPLVLIPPTLRPCHIRLMPELPDITIYLEALQKRVLGRRLIQARVRSPFLLRTASPPLTSLHGKAVTELGRIGKRIVFGFEDEQWLISLL